MADILRWPPDLAERDCFGFFEDFLWYISPHMWTSLAADTNATVALNTGAVGGILNLKSGDAVDNNEAAVKTTNEIFLSGISRPLYFEARIQYTEPTNNVANVAVGLMDVFGSADTLLDNGGGPAATFYGALIYKVDGETVWRCAASAGALSSTGTVTQTNVTAGGAAYHNLAIRIEPVSGAFNQSRVSYFMDGLPLTDSSNKPIAHQVAHGAVATGEMECGVYIKSGDGVVNNFTCLVDYVTCWQRRPPS